MTDNVTLASRRPGGAAHLVRGASPYGHVKGPLNLRASAAQTLHRRQDVSVYNAATQPVDALTSGGYSDIVLRHSAMIQSVTLKLTMEHPTGVAVGARDMFWIFDHIDVLASGSTVIERIEPEHLWLAFTRLNASEQAAIIWGLSGGLTADPTVEFNTGTSPRSFYIPLLHSFLSDHHIAVGFTTNEPITLRCYFRGPSWTGPGNVLVTQPTIASFQAIVRGYEDDHEMQLKRSRYLASAVPMHIRYARPSFQKTIESMSSGRTTVRLASVQGLVTSMTVFVRAVSETKILLPINTVDVLQNGSSIYGQALDSVYLESDEAALEGQNASAFSGVGSNDYLALSLPIGSAGSRRGEARGALLGYRVFDGSSFELVLTGPVVATDVEVVVLYRAVAVAAITRGRISIQQS